MIAVFNTTDDRNAYAAKCIQAGMDPRYVAAGMGYKSAEFMAEELKGAVQPVYLAEHSRHQHLTAKLKAYHAARLQRKGHTDAFVARRCGYSSASVMRKAIKRYIKSPVPVGAGNGADQNFQQQDSTKEATCQC